ncbi:MAG: hypothetical protein QOE86_289 [Solirubrobacteraceae bacterium]|jgi:hypothetical protein|nr:hypothetical protein [Solirubrobacteraceae bacterium]
MGRRLLPLLTAAVALAGCGGRTPSDSEQVRTVLQTFATATEQRDYSKLCAEVFSAKLLTGLQQIGLPCEIAMKKSLGEVKHPRLTVGKVSVKGRTATADVRTAADGQQPSSDKVQLEKVKGSWRVSSLGS